MIQNRIKTRKLKFCIWYILTVPLYFPDEFAANRKRYPF